MICRNSEVNKEEQTGNLLHSSFISFFNSTIISEGRSLDLITRSGPLHCWGGVTSRDLDTCSLSSQKNSEGEREIVGGESAGGGVSDGRRAAPGVG